jgi:hypothetical protein
MRACLSTGHYLGSRRFEAIQLQVFSITSGWASAMLCCILKPLTSRDVAVEAILLIAQTHPEFHPMSGVPKLAGRLHRSCLSRSSVVNAMGLIVGSFTCT